MTVKRTTNWIQKNKRWAIYMRDNCKCVYCDATIGDGALLTLDHITPVAKTGTANNKHTNLITSCRSCNSSKSDKSMSRWLRVLKERGTTDEKINDIKNAVRRAKRGKDSRKRSEDTLRTRGYYDKAEEFLNDLNNQ